MSELHLMTATQLLDAYRRKALSPLDVAEALVQHIDRWEGHLNALYGYRAESFLDAARASSER